MWIILCGFFTTHAVKDGVSFEEVDAVQYRDVVKDDGYFYVDVPLVPDVARSCDAELDTSLTELSRVEAQELARDEDLVELLSKFGDVPEDRSCDAELDTLLTEMSEVETEELARDKDLVGLLSQTVNLLSQYGCVTADVYGAMLNNTCLLYTSDAADE